MKMRRGYIAVVSAIIISSILSLVVFSTSASVFIARFGQLDNEDRIRSKELAFSCVYEALYAYAEDHAYSPDHQMVMIGQRENGEKEDCSIDSIVKTDETLTLYVHASMRSAYTALKVVIRTTNPLSIISWHEITSTPP